MAIRFSFEKTGKKKSDIKDQNSYDFDSENALKDSIINLLKDFACPSCGGRQVEGKGLIIGFAPMEFYREVAKKRLFGKDKHVDEYVKTMYRLENLSLESGGYIRCTRKVCNWSQSNDGGSGSGGGTRWLSANDIFTGRF
ncbi:MAG: hypothetical protein SFH39_18905 [Candidatus Magnetobacterium sp. LHC-1]